MKRLPIFLGILIVLSVAAVHAQIRPVYDRGVMGLVQILKRLNTNANVLMIGAHPDDEDTALLSYLARGENTRTAYLSLTRGDGGQNILGPELGETLGLIRTEELIQARKLDGAEQFFGRAYDYGFSKTLAEAKEKWDEKTILCDTVRVIRHFRPTVVVSQFSGTSADGHGQHQFAGYISPIAVRAAEDPAQCTESGKPWKVAKFYSRQRGQVQPTLQINTGKYDPRLGRSYFEIAMEARSQHRSQEQGVLELKGDQFSNLKLAGSEARENSIFEGLDITELTVPGLSADAKKAIGAAARSAQREFDINAPEKIIPHLLEGYSQVAQALAGSPDAADKAVLRSKQNDLMRALQIAAGIQIDAIADRETYVPGDTIRANVKVFTANKEMVKLRSIEPLVGAGWTVSRVEPPRETAQGFFRRDVGDHFAYFDIVVPKEARFTEPYWLSQPRSRDMFVWDTEDEQRGMPLHRPLPRAVIDLEVAGKPVRFEAELEYRYADDTRGEIRRNVNIVPPVSVSVDQPLLIVPTGTRAQTKRIVVTVTNHSNGPVGGRASLELSGSGDWKFASTADAFEMKRRGETATIPFDITIPSRTRSGAYQITAQALLGETKVSLTMNVVSYPHIQTHRIYRRAATEVRVFDLEATPSRIGYVAGSGDRVPEAIRQMGLNVEMVSDDRLRSGDLSIFDAIVVGIRASEVRPDFVANNVRLLDYARNGGTLIVQYQRPAYAPLAPFPAQMGPRVADENAPVRIMVPEHSIFNYPNKITNTDFEGWVQERNLYNFSAMDPKYTGLLESHDPGEAENTGGLVIADIGKGKYIYCSYSLFRQLPAGVPGAYRLLANMLSVAKVKK